MKRVVKTVQLYRWQIAFTLLLAGVLALAGWGFWLLGSSLLTTIDKLSVERTIERKSLFWQNDQIEAQKRIALVEEYSASLKPFSRCDESQVLGVLYARADSAGFKYRKIEIGEAVQLTNWREIPVRVDGLGSWEAIGRFTAAVESMPYAVRVRQLTIGGAGTDSGGVALDFVLLDSLRGGGK